jgi:hypothetical protein
MKKNMSKKRFILFLFFFLLTIMIFSFSQTIFAAYTYNPMEPIPGFESAVSDFPTYILNIYKFGIWTVGIAALLMISIGGFMYFTSAGNTSKMDQAKRVIWDALFGLIVAMAAYLLLYVINPDLVKVTISLKAVPPPSAVPVPPPAAVGGPVTWPPSPLPAGTLADTIDLRNRLREAGIIVNKANCTYIGQRGCTSLDGIPASTIDKLIADRSIIGDFTITGGTEYWLHNTHGPGIANVDVAPNAPKSQWNDILTRLVVSGGASQKSFCDNNGNHVPCTQASHLHLYL